MTAGKQKRSSSLEAPLLDNFAKMTSEPSWKIENETEARNWITSLVDQLVIERKTIDDIDPNAKGGAHRQRKAGWSYLTKVGSAQGAIVALHRTGMISSSCADELNQRCLAALVRNTGI